MFPLNVLAVLDEIRPDCVKCLDYQDKVKASPEGAVKEAWQTLYEDTLWRIRRRVGQLWFGIVAVDEDPR